MNVNKKRLKILSKIGSTDMQELVAYLIDQYREIDKQNLKRIAELEERLRVEQACNRCHQYYGKDPCEDVAVLKAENKRLEEAIKEVVNTTKPKTYNRWISHPEKTSIAINKLEALLREGST